MGKGIGPQQQRILDMLALRPEGLTRRVIQAQLWPELYCTDYRFTRQSSDVVKQKAKTRVILARTLAALKERGLIEEGRFEFQTAKDVHALGLRLPYQLQMRSNADEPHNGSDLGRMLKIKAPG